jgi:FkbM family methyltransferase
MITEKIKARYGDFYIIKNDAYICRSLKEYGEWSQGEMHIYETCIRKNSCVIEVGSHIGSLTVPISKLCNSVFAFEPQRKIFQLLNTNLCINNVQNVYAYMNAVGNENKQIILKELDFTDSTFDNGVNTGGIRLDQLEANSNGYHIPIVKLDDVIPPEAPISFIKVDAETMELEVIKGAEKIIKNNRPILYLESNPKSNMALENYVKELGYKVYAHTPDYFNPDNFNKNQERIFPPVFSSPDGSVLIYDFMILCIPNEVTFNTNLIQL